VSILRDSDENQQLIRPDRGMPKISATRNSSLSLFLIIERFSSSSLLLGNRETRIEGNAMNGTGKYEIGSAIFE
jgi:hypothetical protein